MVVSALHVPGLTRNRTGAGLTALATEPGMSPLQRAPGPFRDRTDTRLGTASRLQGRPGLALCDSSPHNQEWSYSWIKGTPFTGKRTMEPH